MKQAHEIAASPELYNLVWRIPNSRQTWECLGYSRTGKNVRFGRIFVAKNGVIRQITTYVHPDIYAIQDTGFIVTASDL